MKRQKKLKKRQTISGKLILRIGKLQVNKLRRGK